MASCAISIPPRESFLSAWQHSFCSMGCTIISDVRLCTWCGGRYRQTAIFLYNHYYCYYHYDYAIVSGGAPFHESMYFCLYYCSYLTHYSYENITYNWDLHHYLWMNILSDTLDDSKRIQCLACGYHATGHKF